MYPNLPEILQDPFSQRLWSHDASLCAVRPKGVALPASTEEVQQLIKYAKLNRLSITARGGGTGTTGAALGQGLVIDTSKSMRAITSFDPATGLVTVQPGATLDDLNFFLRPFGRQCGADVSTNDRATIGGMISCNAAGAHSRMWGSMREQIESVTAALANGSTLSFGFEAIDALSPIGARLYALGAKYRDAIAAETPLIQRRSFHLPLDELIHPHGIHVGKLFAGSQGTLGIITEATLKTVPLTQVQNAYLISCPTIESALEKTASLAHGDWYGIELIDSMIIEASKKQVDQLFSKEYKAYILLESLLEPIWTGPPDQPGMRKLSPDEYEAILKMRKEGLSALLSSHKEASPCGFIEDLICPIDAIIPFYTKIFSLLKEQNIPYAVYGHLGAGCLHIRPFIQLNASGQELIVSIMQKTAKIVLESRGVMSSEHGSGIIRSWMAPLFFSQKYLQALQEVKEIFDPNSIMNPGKLFPPYSDFRKFLSRSSTKGVENTFFKSHAHGGLQERLDSCTNNGRCRKGQGLMCPPFQSTRDERDSTRGRVHALLESIENRAEASGHENSFDRILDLCVQCKGCIQECPSHINMAKMKEEELWRQRSERPGGYSRKRIRSWLFAHLTTAFATPLSSLLLRFGRIRTFFEKLLLLSPGTLLLRPSRKKNWKYLSSPIPKKPTLILFADSFSTLFQPEVIDATLSLLQKLGEAPAVYTTGCCGRALFSKGYLEEAESRAQKMLHEIAAFPKDIPILFLEPSCWSAIQDEWQDLPNTDSLAAEALARRSIRIEEFLFSKQPLVQRLYQPAARFQPKRFFVHEHCHTRSLDEQSLLRLKNLLQSAPNISIVFDQNSSCCGMAGSFGLEREHAEISEELGHRTFARVDQNRIDGIVAPGISCRMQAKKLFPDIPVYHPVELLGLELPSLELPSLDL